MKRLILTVAGCLLLAGVAHTASAEQGVEPEFESSGPMYSSLSNGSAGGSAGIGVDTFSKVNIPLLKASHYKVVVEADPGWDYPQKGSSL